MMWTVRQRVLKWIYPLFLFTKKNHQEKGLVLFNQTNQKPQTSFYTLKATSNHGEEISMNKFMGKKILIVNVASNCGFTGQYEELEKLYQEHKDHLIVLGFPSNDFKKQEPGNDQQIEQFCRINYGVTFPLFKKQSVVGTEQSEIYQWLSSKAKNGWNDQSPVWNFSKYLIDEEGKLLAFYGPGVSPLSSQIKI